MQREGRFSLYLPQVLHPRMKLAEVTELHEAARAVAKEGLQRHAVEFPELANFHSALRSFKQRVETHRLEQYCEQLIKECEVFHARTARSPFSPSFCAACQPDLRAQLETVASRSLNFDPSARLAFEALMKSFVLIAACAENPVAAFVRDLLNKLSPESTLIVVRRLCQKIGDTGGVIESTSHTREVLNVPDDSRNVLVVTAAQTRDGAPVDNLLFFGPLWALRWNKTEFLVRSPIAPRVHFVVCGHETVGAESLSLIKDDSLVRINGTMEAASALDAAPIVIDHDWGARLDASRLSATDEDDSLQDKQLVVAVPVAYAGGKGEYLDASKAVIVLRVHGNKCSDVEKVLPGHLAPGDYVFRATGGSDSDVTPAFANQLLGERAAALRQAQASWKKALRQKILQTSMRTTIGILRQAGCEAISTANLRNWQSDRNIAPENLENSLRPILRVLGLESQYHQIEKATKLLRRAHHVAGNRLHQLVLKRLRREDLTELLIKGWFEVRDNQQGPCKTAFRIQDIGAEREVPRHRVGRIFDIGSSPHSHEA
jgi:hypothetical protein